MRMLLLVLALLPIAGFSQDKARTVLPKGCVACHAEETKFPVRGARSQYLTSGHRKLGHASYANSEGCQACHTHEGFVERVKKGKVDPKAVVANPSEIGCFTCHAPHEKGDFSLRTAAKVTLTNGAAFDKGNSNLCAGCHRVLYVTTVSYTHLTLPTILLV